MAFLQWAKFVREHGGGFAYQADPRYNYPPLMAWTLWLFAKLAGTDANLLEYFDYYKLFPLACDFAAAAVAVKCFARQRGEIICLLVLIANPIFIYDSYFWGQVDAVYGALVFFSLMLALRDRPVGSLLCYLLALNFKVQPIVYAPLLALVFWWKWRNPWTTRQVGTAVGVAAVAQGVILLPVVLAGQFWPMITVLRHAVGYFPKVSFNAYNFWHLFYGRDSLNMKDYTPVFAGVSSRHIGEFLFLAFAAAVLAPWLIAFWRAKFLQLRVAMDESRLLLLFALITLFFFFFCTESHERFSTPALLYVAAYAFHTRRYFLLPLALLPYGLNMDYILRHFAFPNYEIWPFDSRLVAALYAILIAALLWFYFRPPAKTDAPPPAPA